MFEGFLLGALLAGIGLALMTGPVGCFVVWRKLAYFGDAISHSALLGLALGFLIGTNPDPWVILTCFIFSLLLLSLERQGHLSSDSYLGILAHGALAFGIIALTLLQTTRVDLHTYLLGDLFLTSSQEIFKLFGLAIVVNLLLFWVWKPLLLLTIHSGLASAEGISELRTRLIFFLMISISVGISMRIVGALLLNAMLILPAATSGLLARSPFQMVVLAMLFQVLATSIGIFFSYYYDIPSSPAIIATMSVLFATIAGARTLAGKR